MPTSRKMTSPPGTRTGLLTPSGGSVKIASLASATPPIPSIGSPAAERAGLPHREAELARLRREVARDQERLLSVLRLVAVGLHLPLGGERRPEGRRDLLQLLPRGGHDLEHLEDVVAEGAPEGAGDLAGLEALDGLVDLGHELARGRSGRGRRPGSPSTRPPTSPARPGRNRRRPGSARARSRPGPSPGPRRRCLRPAAP